MKTTRQAKVYGPFDLETTVRMAWSLTVALDQFSNAATDAETWTKYLAARKEAERLQSMYEVTRGY